MFSTPMISVRSPSFSVRDGSCSLYSLREGIRMGLIIIEAPRLPMAFID